PARISNSPAVIHILHAEHGLVQQADTCQNGRRNEHRSSGNGGNLAAVRVIPVAKFSRTKPSASAKDRREKGQIAEHIPDRWKTHGSLILKAAIGGVLFRRDE